MRITLKKLFGLEGNEQDSIGAMVDGMDISPDKLFRLKESLGAALSPRSGENWALNKLRKTATLTLLSHVSSTLFQIADIGLNAYKHGIGRSLISLFRKKPIKETSCSVILLMSSLIAMLSKTLLRPLVLIVSID